MKKDKKNVIINFGRENVKFFLKNVIQKKRHSEILVCEKFSVPPNSAPGVRHYKYGQVVRAFVFSPFTTNNISSCFNGAAFRPLVFEIRCLGSDF